jgi:hypothetical protein
VKEFNGLTAVGPENGAVLAVAERINENHSVLACVMVKRNIHES